MNGDNILKIGVLAFVFVMMLTGSFRLAQDGRDGSAFWAAGLITLGVLIAVQLHDRFSDHDHKEDDDDERR